MKRVKGVDPSLKIERDMMRAIQEGINRMSSVYRKEVIAKISQDGFSDAKTTLSNLVGMNKMVESKMLSAFSDNVVRRIVRRFLGKVDSTNIALLKRRLPDSMAIEMSERLNSESESVKELIEDAYEWVEKARNDTIKAYSERTLSALKEGKGLDYIEEQFKNIVETRKNHAKTVARTQVANFNAQVSEIRARDLGIKKAIWRTARDERVRGRPGGKYPNAKPSHWALEGQEFDLSKGIKTPEGYIKPGSEINCRCTFEFVIDEE